MNSYAPYADIASIDFGKEALQLASDVEEGMFGAEDPLEYGPFGPNALKLIAAHYGRLRSARIIPAYLELVAESAAGDSYPGTQRLPINKLVPLLRYPMLGWADLDILFDYYTNMNPLVEGFDSIGTLMYLTGESGGMPQIERMMEIVSWHIASHPKPGQPQPEIHPQLVARGLRVESPDTISYYLTRLLQRIVWHSDGRTVEERVRPLLRYMHPKPFASASDWTQTDEAARHYGFHHVRFAISRYLELDQ